MQRMMQRLLTASQADANQRQVQVQKHLSAVHLLLMPYPLGKRFSRTEMHQITKCTGSLPVDSHH
jgi:hypothetical protein